MSDELNDPALEAYLDASYADAKGGGTLAAAERAAAVIRDYGDKRYQQAIDDVVEWLRSGDAFALTDHEAAAEITRRFGNGA